MQHEFHSFTVAQLDVSELIKKQSIKKAPKMIKNLIVDIKCRNKLINPPDKLPGGWKNVDEYVPDSLGSNSEEERNIRSSTFLPTQIVTFLDQHNDFGMPKKTQNFKFGGAQDTQYFTCEKVGHWRKDCPNTKPDRRWWTKNIWR